MNVNERRYMITAKMYEEKLEKVLHKSDYENLQKEIVRYLMIDTLVTLPWTSPFAQMIKKDFHITEDDVKKFYKKFPSLEQEDDHGRPACDLEFDYEPEEEEDRETVEFDEFVENILNDCACCVFYNSEDDCCENNARICTYKEED